MKDATMSLATSSRSRLWPWQVCCFLLFATAMSYLDRQALSIAAPVIRREMGLDNAQLGLLLSAFFYSYAVGHLVVGWILDRLPMRVTYGAFVALWSIAQAAAGLVPGFHALFGVRVALGAFEAAAQPGAARIVASVLTEKDRSLANGIMMSGGSLGAIIAPPLMIWLSNSVGWRYGFLVLGGLGLLWAFAWLAWFRPPAGVEFKTRSRGAREPWPDILRGRRFWLCVAGAAFGTPIIHVSSAWVPTYFTQRWNLPLSAGLGLFLLIIYVGLDLGFLAGGAASRLLARGGMAVARSRRTVMGFALCCMLAAAAVPFAPSPVWAVVFVFLLNFGRAAYGANYLAFNQEIARTRVGFMAGLMGAIGAFSGALLVWLIGLISNTGGFQVPFLMVTGLAVLGVVPFLLISWDHHSRVQSSTDLG